MHKLVTLNIETLSIIFFILFRRYEFYLNSNNKTKEYRVILKYKDARLI